jgi:hypothetical protein
MPRLELGDHLRQRQTLDLEQQQRVVQKIGGLADDLCIGLSDGGEREFQSFLADFLCDPPRAFAQELRGVAARRTRGDSLHDDLLECPQERGLLRGRSGRILSPTGGRAQMTDGSYGFGQDQQGVAVAIAGDLTQIQEVARGLPLGPEAPLAAAPEGDSARGLRRRQGFPVHVSEHEHRAAAGVLNDGRQQTAALVPVEFLHSRTSIPAPRRRRFRLGMAISPEWNTLAASAASTWAV